MWPLSIPYQGCQKVIAHQYLCSPTIRDIPATPLDVFIDHEAGEIICLVASIRPSVCLLANTLLLEPFDL